MSKVEALRVLGNTQLAESTVKAMAEKFGHLSFPARICIYHSTSESDRQLASIIQAVIVLVGGEASLASCEMGNSLYSESIKADVVILLCSYTLFEEDNYIKDFYFVFRRTCFGKDEKKLVAVSLDRSIPAYRDEDIPNNSHLVAMNLLSYFNLNMRYWEQGQLEEGLSKLLSIISSKRGTGRPPFPSK